MSIKARPRNWYGSRGTGTLPLGDFAYQLTQHVSQPIFVRQSKVAWPSGFLYVRPNQFSQPQILGLPFWSIGESKCRLAPNVKAGGQTLPNLLLAGKFVPSWAAPVVFAGPGWGSSPGVSGVAIPPGTTWLDCAKSRQKTLLWPAPWGLDSLLPPWPSVSRV